VATTRPMGNSPCRQRVHATSRRFARDIRCSYSQVVRCVRRSKRCTAISARLAAGALCVASAGLVPARAGAQSVALPPVPQSVPSAIEYLAPPACPTRAQWLARVRERLADVEGGWSIERLAAVPARVTLSPAGTEASIVFHDGGLERSIAGADCEEVASAAALIFAVALGSSTPVVSRAADSFAPPPSTSDARIDAPPTAPSGASERRWAIALGASAEANAWTGPWPAGVLGVSVDAVAPSRGWSARAAGNYGSSVRVVDGRRAEFQYWGGHLDLCPIALGAITAWRWVSCAELHLGVLQGKGDEGSALSNGRSPRALLATAVATTRLTTPPLWALRLQVETGVAVPLVLQTFQFGAPEQVIFESPAVGLLARAGILVPLDGQRD
jgi:hypothetical protein